jgi:hypothetical protein
LSPSIVVPADLATTASVAVLIAYVILAWILGRLLVGLLSDEPSVLLRTTSPLLGGAMLGLQLWLYGAVHVPWVDLTMVTPWLLLAASRWRRLGVSLTADLREVLGEIRLLILGTGHLEALLAILITTMSFVYLVNLVTQPVLGWDAIAMWLFKAKVFYLQQAADLGPIASDVRRNLDYPPLYPLMVDSSYVLIGHLDEVFGKSVTFLFFLTGLLGFYVTVNELIGRLPALVFSFLLAALPIFGVALFSDVQMGWADYPVGILMLVSLLHLFRGQLMGDKQSYLAAVVFAALAAITKNEGLSFLGIVTLLLLVVLVKVIRTSGWPRIPVVFLIVGFSSLVPVVAWQIYLRLHGIHPAQVLSVQGLAATHLSLATRAIVILRIMHGVVVQHSDYPWIGVDLALALLLIAVRRRGPAIFLAAAVLLQLAAYFLVYLVTPYDLIFLISTSLDRLVLQITPSLLLLLAVSLYPFRASTAS